MNVDPLAVSRQFCPLHPFLDGGTQPFFEHFLFVFRVIFQAKHVFDVERIDNLFAIGRDHRVGDIHV